MFTRVRLWRRQRLVAGWIPQGRLSLRRVVNAAMPPCSLLFSRIAHQIAIQRGIPWIPVNWPNQRFPYSAACCPERVPPARPRQRWLQYLTLSQSSSHFLRQLNGRLHTAQFFCGRFFFKTPRGMMTTALIVGRWIQGFRTFPGLEDLPGLLPKGKESLLGVGK